MKSRCFHLTIIANSSLSARINTAFTLNPFRALNASRESHPFNPRFPAHTRTFTSTSTSHIQLNPYTVLEVPKSASLADIKRAYKAQVFKYHPDRNKSSTKFLSIVAAYKLLTNPLDKRSFDQHGHTADASTTYSPRASNKSQHYSSSSSTYKRYSRNYQQHVHPEYPDPSKFKGPIYMSSNKFALLICTFALFMSYTIYYFGFVVRMERYKAYVKEQQEVIGRYKVGHRESIAKGLREGRDAKDAERVEKEVLSIDEQKKIVNEALDHWRQRDQPRPGTEEL